MSEPHKWTEREVSRMKTLRDEGESFKTIAEILGTVSKGQALRKFREVYGDDGRRANISKTSPRPWTEKDLQTLKDGYAAGDDIEDIIARLDDKRTIDTIYVKASKLGITKPKARKPKVTATNSVTTKAARPKSIKPKAAPANDSAHPVNIDIERVGTFLLAGITPFEAAALESVPTDAMRAAYEQLGWQEMRIAPNTRISVRSAITEEARQLAGENIDTANPSHLMIVLSLAADRTQRNLAETARLSLLPLAWVERVFGRLDAEGVWPVTDRSRNDLTPSDYERFSEICEQEAFILKQMISASMVRAA